MMKEEFYYLWTTGRGLYVLSGLLFLGIFVSPLMISEGLISDVLIECVFAMILITGVFTTPCSMTIKLGMLLIAFLSVFTRILHKFNHSNFTLAVADNILAVITLVAFSVLIIKHFLIDKTILRYRIAAAVAVYLIFGVLWARLYEIVYLFNPAAFPLSESINPFSLIYFSFVTLMTIGYGDIVPVSMAARSLAMLEGVVGQLYMVILISSLVSEFSALAIKSSKEQN
ncbi:MAG: potassium channel family protein [Parachlamydiales bacterium]|jgi:hypothetical protein